VCIQPDAVVDFWGPGITDPKEELWLAFHQQYG